MGERPEDRESEQERFTITDLSRAFDITARTLRFYEDEGLIRPERRGSTRLYTRADRARLQWILRGRAVGFSLSDIKELLDLYAPGEERREQLLATVGKCRTHIGQLEAQRAAIEDTIREINAFCDSVQEQLQQMEKE